MTRDQSSAMLDCLPETRLISSSARDMTSFRTGKAFSAAYAMASATVGVSPDSGRYTTDQGSRFLACAGISESTNKRFIT